MQKTHIDTIDKYEKYRFQARGLAESNLPSHLQKDLTISNIGHKEMAAFRTWQGEPERKVDWNWEFAGRYCVKYPKSFDMSVWFGNTLSSLSLGRPTYNGTEIRLDFVERAPKYCPHSGEIFRISLLAFELYGDLIGANKLRIMQPLNDKLIKYYMSYGGFSFVPSIKGNPHYLVRDL